MVLRKSIELEGRTLSIEVGRLAKQADGAALVQYGGTVVLAAVVASRTPIEQRDFIPLSVEYREKSYAAGRIPGGFFKREGRPQEKEVLSARLIDRPIRPNLSKEFPYEIQVIVTVLSSDKENDADIMGTVGVSLALSISNIPFNGPLASVRVGRVDGKWIINPTFGDLEKSDMNVVVAASEEAIVMVEGEAVEISEGDLVSCLERGHQAVREIIRLQKSIMEEIPVVKRSLEPDDIEPDLADKVRKATQKGLPAALALASKKERHQALEALLESIQESLSEEYPEQEDVVSGLFHEAEKEYVRKAILTEKRRIDGRGVDDVRPIECGISVLPRTHGSGLFTRGETQCLSIATLGTKVDEQKIDGLDGQSWKSYMLHYNFPPFSVGEVKRIGSPSRREIGHGNLAERSLKPMIPSEEMFPYTIRIVADVLESNGSSSMATVCASSLSLMDAGIPVKSAVAGIAMGLIKEKDQVVILTDILGEEDHLGDMDFKVAGTRKGINAFQMDIKVSGISSDILVRALTKAREARMKILDIMDRTISEPKKELSPFAPRIFSMHIDPADIGAVIGPGGKMIREIQEKTSAEINIEDDGTVQIASADEESCKNARDMIRAIVEKPEPGRIYRGKVKKITNFGAFVEILPGKEGLLHISEIAPKRVQRVEDHLRVGDVIDVKLLKIAPDGKYDLSLKAVLHDKETEQKTS